MKGGLVWLLGLGLLFATSWGCAGSVPGSSSAMPYHVLNGPYSIDDRSGWSGGGSRPGQVDIYNAGTNLVAYDLSGRPDASSSQSGFGPERAVDNDWNTEWASGGYRSPWEALDLNFRHPNQFGRIVIKTGRTDRDYYVVQVWNGREWLDATGEIRNQDWQPHSYNLYLPSNAQTLRVVWHNGGGTTDHASVFGIALYPAGSFGDGQGRGGFSGGPR